MNEKMHQKASSKSVNNVQVNFKLSKMAFKTRMFNAQELFRLAKHWYPREKNAVNCSFMISLPRLFFCCFFFTYHQIYSHHCLNILMSFHLNGHTLGFDFCLVV